MPIPSEDVVWSVVATDIVGPLLPERVVVGLVPLNDIGVVLTFKDVSADPAVDRDLRARPSLDPVSAVATEDGIVSALALDCVVTGPATDQVGPASPVNVSAPP